MKQLLGLLVASTLAACLPPASYAPGPSTTTATYAAPSYTTGTGVYVNDAEISADDKAQLEQLLGGTLPPGRYFVLANGDAGVEGQAASVNLIELARAREAGATASAGQGRPTEIFSTDAAGRQSSMVSDGDCILVSSPDVDFASSGC